MLSRSEQQRLYDSSTRTWTLDSDYLAESENNVQPLIDCVTDSETVVVSRGLVLNMTRTLTIERSIRIEGEGSEMEAPKWTCSSSRGRDRIVTIRGAENVTLSGIDFVNCSAFPAPIVVRNSDVTFSNCRFEENRGDNGGVVSTRRSLLIIRNSIFRRNHADGSGGCIQARDGTTVVQDCVFEENSSMDLGGALTLVNVTTGRVLRSHFLGNAARSGGAMYGSSQNQVSELTVDGCTFNRNHADERGGAITLVGMEASISSSSFRRNNGSAGGALFLQNLDSSGSSEPTILRIADCDFTRNTASSIGGAVLFQGFIEVGASAVSFVRNNAGTDGGAIALQSEAALTHLNANETGLEAILSLRDGVCERNSASHGGCLSAVNESTVQLTNFVFLSNSALENGGGLHAEQLNSLRFMNVSFSDNQAAGLFGGGAFISSDLVEDRETNISTIGRSTFIVIGCRLENNRALIGAGLFIYGYVSVSIDRSLFVSNRQIGGGTNASTVDEIARGGAAGIHMQANGYERADSYNTVFNIQRRGINVREVLEQARASLDSPPAENSENVVPALSMTINNSVFASNQALGSSGAMTVISGCLLWVHHTEFRENRASDVGGGLYVRQSLFFCQHCVFENNQAGISAGACELHGRTSDSNRGTTVTEGHFRDSLFVNNSGDIAGGAVAVDGLEAYLFSLENVTYQGNKARAGGAIASVVAAQVVVRTGIFVQNRADVAGGALSMSFLQFRRNRYEINNAVLTQNTALLGGAIYAEYYVYAEHQADTRLLFHDPFIHPSIQLNDTVVTNNSATNGGALFLKSVRGLLSNVTIEDNNASEMGGACVLDEGSVVLLINGTLRRNEAATGGAIMIGERSMLHCAGCEIVNNTASVKGGGMSIAVSFRMDQSVIFQCETCSITRNRARLGGGLYVTHQAANRSIEHSEEAIIVLRNTELVENHAELGGGGIMVSHPECVAINCSTDQLPQLTANNISAGFLQTSQTISMQRLSERSCASWRGNTVGADGYGAEKATFVSRAEVCVIDGEACHLTDGKLHSHRSASPVPPIRITLVDYFGMQPAAPWPDYQFLLVYIESSEEPREVILSGQLNALVEGGEAVFNGTTVTGPPGAYGLLIYFSDDRIPHISLNTELQPCLVGEQSVLGNLACQPCEAGSYRVQEPLDVCKDCPDNCICDKWGIAPVRNYWMPSPCSTAAEECLSDRACEYDGREAALDEFFSEQDPTCDLPESAIEDFRRIQCREGYEGPRCGTCSDGYGSVAFDCRRCVRRALIALLLMLNVLWFLVLCGVAIRGNLTENDLRKEKLSHRRQSSNLETDYAGSQAIGGPARHLLRVQTSDGSQPLSNGTQYNHAKRNVAERLKLFVNFAQVNSMALAINTEWMQATSTVLRSLDSIGAVSAEAAISLDCLFSESSSVPRSVSKALLSLLTPSVLLAVLSVFWAIKLRKDWQLLKRRLLLSVLIVLYISYIGLARRLFSVLYCVRIYDGLTVENSSHFLYWSQDTSVKCYEGSHALLLGIVTVPLIFVILLGFPIGSAIFLFLARRKQALESDNLKETFGFMYQAYKKEYVFWDCTILLRKAALALIVTFGSSLDGNVQELVALSVIGLSLYVHINFLPFNDSFASLNSNEKFSLVVSLITFLSGVFLNDSCIPSGGKIFISVFTLLVNLSFVLYSVCNIYSNTMKVVRLSLEQDNVFVLDKGDLNLLFRWATMCCSKSFSKWRKNDISL